MGRAQLSQAAEKTHECINTVENVPDPQPLKGRLIPDLWYR